MTTYEWLTLIGIIMGPIVAVAITLWIEARRSKHDQRVFVLRQLVATRHLHADPAFFTAINVVPVEFNDERAVLDAHRDFIDAVGKRLDGVNDQTILENSATKLTRLIYQISRSVGFDLRETDIQTTAYASQGWVQRDYVLLDSQRAMRDVASILAIQTKLLAQQSVSAEDIKFIDQKLPDSNA